MSKRPYSRLCLSWIFSFWILGGIALLPAQEGSPAERVRQAALVTYIHGITDEIALEQIGPDGVGYLLELLMDPAFPRRDNVVAFLAHLGDDQATGRLVGFLESPPRDVSVPEEDRALLLTPQALGQIASRGAPQALETLLTMTGPGNEGGVLVRAAAGAGGGPSLRDDLLEMALRGLAYSGSDVAGQRLTELNDGRVQPTSEGRDLRLSAASALDLMEALHGPAVLSGSPSSRTTAAADLDTSARVHDSPLTYANHVDHQAKMTDSRLDSILQEASLRAGRDDFTPDVACCITFSRSGSARSFGTAGDGLDEIDDDSELMSVLNDPVSRLKVVRMINWCAGPGTNIIGCSFTPGDGIAVVRLSSMAFEAVLWAHEYGHNTGLRHVTDTRGIMFGTNNGTNNGLDQNECDFFHSPHPFARMAPTDTGACTDDDADAVQDGIDNCPTVPNMGQTDSDLDGIGDACESLDADNDGIPNGSDNCPLVVNPGQADNDGDGEGDLCDADDDNDTVQDASDNCPLLFNPTQADADSDGLGDVCDSCTDRDRDGYGSPGDASCQVGAGNDCDDTLSTIHPNAPEICDGVDNDCDVAADEALCEEFDVNTDAVVDGAELAWLGRAFGLCSFTPSTEWWFPVDYTMDGCVDGEDLAILASVWTCAAPGPICQ